MIYNYKILTIKLDFKSAYDSNIYSLYLPLREHESTKIKKLDWVNI